jgi:hypothetical protein
LSEYKYIIFFIAVVVGVPAGIILAYISKLWERVFIFLMVFFTCNLSGTINFESVKDYRGTSRGFEIGIVDLAALIIFGFMIVKPRFKIKLPPGTILYFTYTVISMLSIQNSANAEYSWFEILKMFKMYFYYLVWFNYFIDLNQIQRVIRILPVLVVYMFMMVLYQWKMGVYQPYGPFTHQNSLCMYVMTIGAIFLAAIFELKMKEFKAAYVIGIFGLCCLIEVLTLSRAGVACYAGCCAVVVFFSFSIRFKPKKVFIFMLMFMVALGGLLFYANSIWNRFMYAPESSMECRENLARSARNMAADGVFGVGLNNFGIKVNADYPYSTHYMPEGFKEGLVESIYLMIAAETGWFNMFVYITLLLYFYVINLRNIYRYRYSKMVYLPIAIAGGLAAIYLQSILEWVLKQPPNFYQLMFFFAVIAAMSKIYKRNSKLTKEERMEAEYNVINL